MSRSDRDSIVLESARVIDNQRWPGDQYIMSVDAPQVAQLARPGSFAHVRCSPDLPMRRPLSIMRANSQTGQVDFLYKIVGQGLMDLGRAQVGDLISILAPIGNGFDISKEKTIPLLIGGGVGIPPMVFMADWLTDRHESHRPVMFMGSELPFPFATGEAPNHSESFPESATHSLNLADELGVTCRLASKESIPGAYDGYVTDLARQWIQSQPRSDFSDMEILACGPEPMLAAAANLAREFDLTSQLCLEEYMACGVGGCAGCAVEITMDGQKAMKRVCVDGPVFSGDAIYPG